MGPISSVSWLPPGLLVLAVLLASISGTVRAQDVSGGGSGGPDSVASDPPSSEIDWSVEARGSYLDLESPRRSWRTQSAAVSAGHRSGTYRLAVRRERRFGNEEWLLLAEAYPQLWTGAYGHLRLAGAAPGRTAAELDGLARLYQTFGRWETSLGTRFMRFPDARPVSTDIGVGRYGVGWYATVGYQLVRVHERTVSGASGLVRWYLQGDETYLDVRSSHGQEVGVVGSGPETRLLRSTSVSVSVHLPLGARLSLIPELRYVDQPGLTRWGGSFAVRLDL